MRNMTTHGADEMELSAPTVVHGNKDLYRDLLIVFMLAVSLRAVFLFRSFGDAEHRQMVEDSYAYLTLADNLLAGQGFGRIKPVGPHGEEVWTPELCRTPGYPVMIGGLQWLTGHGRAATIIFQHILGVALCLIVMVVCWRHFGRRAGLVAGCLLALDLQAIGLSSLLLSDLLFCFLLFLSVLLVAKGMEDGHIRFGLGAGLFLALSILTKPAGIALPVVLSAVLVIYSYLKRRRHLIPVAVVMCVFAYVPVMGWVVRNGIVCGEYVFCSVPRISLLLQASVSLARSAGIPRDVAAQRLATEAGVSIAQLRYSGLPPEKTRRIREVEMSTIIAHRSSYAREFARSALNLLLGPDKDPLRVLGLPHVAFGVQAYDATNLARVSAASVTILAFQSVILGSIYVMLVLTLRTCIRSRRVPILVLLCLIAGLYVLTLSSIPEGDPRYRSAAVPLLVIVAAAFSGVNKQEAIRKGTELYCGNSMAEPKGRGKRE